jgi:hypothetical protein
MNLVPDIHFYNIKNAVKNLIYSHLGEKNLLIV